MDTINRDIVSELKIKNSLFITCLFYIESEDDISRHLADVREKYPKATHYCYCYILGSRMRASDDGEPSGTAGIPMLNVLKQKNIGNILVVVVRYFGGIKLGAGGLLRAYVSSVTMALDKCEIVSIVPGVKVRIHLGYDEVDEFLYFAKVNDISIISKVFKDEIYYVILIDKNNLNLLSKYKYEVMGFSSMKKRTC